MTSGKYHELFLQWLLKSNAFELHHKIETNFRKSIYNQDTVQFFNTYLLRSCYWKFLLYDVC